MILYSETTKIFIQKVRHLTREIITNEMNLKMDKSRVLYNRFYYPLNIIVFEDPNRLGYFDARFFELGISKKLIYLVHDHVLKNIIRHELAHFMCYLLHGHTKAHGEEFHQVCKMFKWDEEVQRAYINLDFENEKIEGDLKTQRLLEKLKKLLSLTSSDNPHERELATLKANELLLNHNLDLAFNEDKIDDTIYVKRVIEAKRKETKHVAIYEILKTFYVAPIFNHGKGAFYLEVIGDKTSVELAEYVANFLDNELENMWKLTKKNNPHLKNISAKNSYFRGVSRGYCDKIENQKMQMSNSKDLVVLDKNLSLKVKQVYARLGHSSLSSGLKDENARKLGVESGKNLSIKPGISSQIKKIFLLD